MDLWDYGIEEYPITNTEFRSGRKEGAKDEKDNKDEEKTKIVHNRHLQKEGERKEEKIKSCLRH